MAHYRYMVQQVQQFRTEEDLAMQQAVSENLKQFYRDLEKKWLEELTLEQRLEGLRPEERLRGRRQRSVAGVVAERGRGCFIRGGCRPTSQVAGSQAGAVSWRRGSTFPSDCPFFPLSPPRHRLARWNPRVRRKWRRDFKAHS